MDGGNVPGEPRHCGGLRRDGLCSARRVAVVPQEERIRYHLRQEVVMDPVFRAGLSGGLRGRSLSKLWILYRSFNRN